LFHIGGFEGAKVRKNGECCVGNEHAGLLAFADEVGEWCFVDCELAGMSFPWFLS
jgi:hypothetical protein